MNNKMDTKAQLKLDRLVFKTDIVNISKPITKFSYKLKDASEIRYVLEKAYHIATTGRPGPVLIDIPLNLQKVKVDPKKLKS